MSAIAQLIIATFESGLIIYVALKNAATGQWWNTTLNSGAGGWETFNAAHWASYAISTVEDAGTGIYSATYPAALAGQPAAIEFSYQQKGASPALSDGPPITQGQSQGVNLVSILGDAGSVLNMLAGLDVEMLGAAVAGTLSTTQMSTNISGVTQANVFNGRTIYFGSGANEWQASAITGGAVVAGAYVLTFDAVNNAPTAGDLFLII